jgi:hypothetical protein
VDPGRAPALFRSEPSGRSASTNVDDVHGRIHRHPTHRLFAERAALLTGLPRATSCPEGHARKGTNVTPKLMDTPRAALERLHAACNRAVVSSFEDGREKRLSQHYAFVSEMEAWSAALHGRPEQALSEVAQREHLLSMLSLIQGQYRSAFKGLRLVLELHLQGILLSTDAIGLHEWLGNAKDTSWSAIVDAENGVFGRRVANAFFPEMSTDVGGFRGLACSLYRELSEATHGNVPKAIHLPDAVVFDATAFDTWCEKAEILRSVVHLAFAVRYVRGLDNASRGHVEQILLERLNTVRPLRSYLGGPIDG